MCDYNYHCLINMLLIKPWLLTCLLDVWMFEVCRVLDDLLQSDIIIIIIIIILSRIF